MANNNSNGIFQQNKAILCTESDFFNSPSKPATTVKHAAFSITPKILPSFFLTLAAQRLWEGCSATGNSCWVFVPQTTRVPMYYQPVVLLSISCFNVSRLMLLKLSSFQDSCLILNTDRKTFFQSEVIHLNFFLKDCSYSLHFIFIFSKPL